MAASNTVTVCIPAYRAGAFIAETVRSVLLQTHADLRLRIAIDPPDDGATDDTAAALQPFRRDARVDITHNPRRLGWAENVNTLLGRVDTPWYAILPHDDVWAPHYLETLLGVLRADPQAVAAYADLYNFGHALPTRKAVVLPQGESRASHLLQFLLQGTEAMPWRAVTRSDTLAHTGGFPTDRHKGFAVECEYALALLGAGPVLHVPRVLYFKRIHPPAQLSASRERLLGVASEVRRAGWQTHARRMTDLLEQAMSVVAVPAADAPLYRAALEAALLARLQGMVEPRLPEAELRRAESLLVDGALPAHPAAPAVAARLHLVLSRHWRTLREAPPAMQHALQAASLDPASAEAALLAASALAAQGRWHEALEQAAQAIELSPSRDNRAAHGLVRQIYSQLGWPLPTPPG